MLIHRASRGVLWEISTFQGNRQCWRRGLRLRDFPELDPKEWWELDDRTALARRCRIFYPNFLPITKGGRLVNIKPTGPGYDGLDDIHTTDSAPDGAREGAI